jgi:Protein of unknown function (DUF4019)
MGGFFQPANQPMSFRMRQPSRTFFVWILLVWLGLTLAGCNASVRRSGIPAGAQAALQEAIEDIDAGRYDKVYQEASDEWRNQSSLEDSTATLQTLRNKLGTARTRTQETAREEQTSTAPVAGHSVTVIYQTTFDRGEAIETFTLVEHGGRWQLAKYYVSSSGLR